MRVRNSVSKAYFTFQVYFRRLTLCLAICIIFFGYKLEQSYFKKKKLPYFLRRIVFGSDGISESAGGSKSDT